MPQARCFEPDLSRIVCVHHNLVLLHVGGRLVEEALAGLQQSVQLARLGLVFGQVLILLGGRRSRRRTRRGRSGEARGAGGFDSRPVGQQLATAGDDRLRTRHVGLVLLGGLALDLGLLLPGDVLAEVVGCEGVRVLIVIVLILGLLAAELDLVLLQVLVVEVISNVIQGWDLGRRLHLCERKST